jgi:hypothetical protein
MFDIRQVKDVEETTSITEASGYANKKWHLLECCKTNKGDGVLFVFGYIPPIG